MGSFHQKKQPNEQNEEEMPTTKLKIGSNQTWKYKVIGSCKQRRTQRNKIWKKKRKQLATKQRMNGMRYRMIGCLQGKKAQRFAHNVLVEPVPFCSCDEFQAILRRLK